MNVLAIGLIFLACGWKFYKGIVYTRYLALKNTGHPQYFGSALCAAFVFVVALCVDQAMSTSGFYKHVAAQVVAAIPVSRESSDSIGQLIRITFWAIPVVTILTTLLNLPMRGAALVMAAAKRIRIIDELEETLYYCLNSGLFVALTLKSNKVYIGVPKRHGPDPDRDSVWLSIWPVASGYRDEHGRLHLRTFYPDIRSAYAGASSIRRPDDFQVVIPISEICVAQSFNLAMFATYRASAAKRKKQQESGQSDESHDYFMREHEKKTILVAKRAKASARYRHQNSGPEALPGLSLSAKDRYLLRTYAYYVAAISLGIVFFPWHAYWASALFLVALLAGFEASEPIGLMVLRLRQRGTSSQR